MNSPHESVTEIATDVWKNNRPLAIALLAALGIVLFILYKKSKSALIAPPAPDGSTPGNLASITYGAITNITENITTNNPGPPPPGPPPPPPPKQKNTGIIRLRNLQAWYDKQIVGGVPIRKTPGATQQVRLAPYGSSIQILGPAVSGGSNFGKNKGGSTQWYPVSGGYISAFDIASIV
jgi:hypothetical protein